MDSVITENTLTQIALTLFLITNPIGNSPAILALVSGFDFASQKRIILREAFIALLIAIFFQYGGEVFLGFLQIQNYAVSLAGGILLFLVSLNMIFSLGRTEEHASLKQEPFIVPIATPILSGSGLLSMIMIFSKEEANPIKITGAILIAWIGVFFFLAIAPYLQRFLGKKGLGALEQLMGLLLMMMSINMIVSGAEKFALSLGNV